MTAPFKSQRVKLVTQIEQLLMSRGPLNSVQIAQRLGSNNQTIVWTMRKFGDRFERAGEELSERGRLVTVWRMKDKQ